MRGVRLLRAYTRTTHLESQGASAAHHSVAVAEESFDGGEYARVTRRRDTADHISKNAAAAAADDEATTRTAEPAEPAAPPSLPSARREGALLPTTVGAMLRATD